MEMRVWRFRNNTTGEEIESNDLKYLLHRVEEDKEIKVTNKVMTDLIIRGKSEFDVTSSGGDLHNITISEHNETKESYFRENTVH